MAFGIRPTAPCRDPSQDPQAWARSASADRRAGEDLIHLTTGAGSNASGEDRPGMTAVTCRMSKCDRAAPERELRMISIRGSWARSRPSGEDPSSGRTYPARGSRRGRRFDRRLRGRTLGSGRVARLARRLECVARRGERARAPRSLLGRVIAVLPVPRFAAVSRAGVGAIGLHSGRCPALRPDRRRRQDRSLGIHPGCRTTLRPATAAARSAPSPAIRSTLGRGGLRKSPGAESLRWRGRRRLRPSGRRRVGGPSGPGRPRDSRAPGGGRLVGGARHRP